MIDAHAHLTDPAFEADLDGVIDRALLAGVERVLTCGEDVASSERALAVARAHPELVRVAVGIHPHRADGCDAAALARLRELAADPLVVAIGEIGMDLSGRSAPLEAQRSAVAAQLALAAELGLPAVLHMRDAAAELGDLLLGGPRISGQLHCYSEGPDELEAWLERGLWISFAGTATFKRNARLREAATRVPSGRLLLETDAPYLTPEPHRGERNEPARVRATYDVVARVRGTTAERLAEDTAAAARELFGDRWE